LDAATEAAMGDEFDEARAVIAVAGRGDALGRAMRASIERQIAGGAAADGRVHLERGDTMWSFANRVLDAAAQADERRGDRQH
jgi:hypothetical protein